MDRALQKDIAVYQDSQAYWHRMASGVRRWLEDQPDNAAARYDLVVYQERARSAYKTIAQLRGDIYPRGWEFAG